jgi:hypothetical protein
MIRLYTDIKSKETYLELWGSSTKHPDSRFCFSTFECSPYTSKEWNIPAWIYWCASRMAFPWDSDTLARFGELCSNMLKEYNKMKARD